jgi:hypothetical protein
VGNNETEFDMKALQSMVAGLGLSLVLCSTWAAVPQHEADELGKSLTQFGAEQAGSGDGTIPPYTGGIAADAAPAGWKKDSGRYDVSPFDSDKVLFSITAANLDKYASHLTAGAVAMLKKYPNFRIDVYPTRRSITYNTAYLAACKGNATGTTIHESGDGFDGSPRLCVPFPIPKTGIEVVWNTLLSNKNGIHSDQRISSWLIDGSGHLTDVGHVVMDYGQVYLDPNRGADQDGVSLFNTCAWDGPPSQVGVKLLYQYPMDYDKVPERMWMYTPGQRRTRLAPELSYDMPIAADGGAINFDEIYGFAGQPDRYDFKLVGKKEIYVPYNANREAFAPMDKLLADTIVDPAVTRWELHRVWVVEATLKAGKRHVEPRRTFYVDEDSWAMVASDAYDATGKIFKIGLYPIVPAWDAHSYIQSMIFYDLSRNTTYLSGWNRPNDISRFSDTVGGYSRFTPAALTSTGIR